MWSLDCGTILNIICGTILNLDCETFLSPDFRALLNYKVILFTPRVYTPKIIDIQKMFFNTCHDTSTYFTPRKHEKSKFLEGLEKHH